MAIKSTGAVTPTTGIDKQVLPRGSHCFTDSVRAVRWIIEYNPLGSELNQVITNSSSVTEKWENQKVLVSYITLHHCHPSQADFLKELSHLSSQENTAARIELVFKMVKALEKCILSLSPARNYGCVPAHIELDRQFLVLLQKAYLRSKM
jgi:hypothetical protein